MAKTYQDFMNAYKGKTIDYDGVYGAQCVDAFKLFCAWAGIPVQRCPDGWAQSYWTGRDALGFSKYFEYISPGYVQPGDWYTTSSGTRTFDTTQSNFKGALNYTLLALKDKFPNKQIVLLTPLHRNTFSSQKTDMQANSQGLYLEDYVNCVKEAGSIFSVNVIDLYHDSGLFPYDTDNASLYFNVSQSDKLHPNAKGHERIAQVIAAKLASIPYTE